jgi:hypothetical protein
MALKFGTTLRNARLDTITSHIGASAKLRVYTGTAPNGADDAPTGTLLATLTLPTTWMGAASGGSKALAGTWTGTAVAAGTAGYFRFYNNAETVSSMQGTITAVGGSGDLTLDNTSVAQNQTVTINSYVLTEANT